MDVQRQVVAFIRREELLPPGERVVVGVSGGPDSLCLLHILWNCRQALGIDVHVAHLNHLIRGAEADADAEFVASLAAQWGIPCTVKARKVLSVAREQKLAVEEAARRVRYAFLAETAQKVGAARIAVGHNADDQSETVLMHWLRGAGLAGLRGMLPATRLADLRLIAGSEARGVWLIRPLLGVPREHIERYCEQHGLSPRFDRSNLDTTMYRNRLRHELLPYLEREFKPHFREILRRSARVIRDDHELLSHLSNSAWQRVVREVSEEAVIFDRDSWRALHPSLQRATLRRAVQHLRRSLRDVSFQHIEAALYVGLEGSVGARSTLPRELLLTVGYDTLLVANKAFVPPPDFVTLTAGPVQLTVPGVTALPDGGQVEIRTMPKEALSSEWSPQGDPWQAFFDADVLGKELSLRRKRAGDRFCPLGMRGRHKLVSELLVNSKVPVWWRDQVPLLVRGDDEIMWVCGWREDERARVRDETSRVMVVRLRMV